MIINNQKEELINQMIKEIREVLCAKLAQLFKFSFFFLIFNFNFEIRDNDLDKNDSFYASKMITIHQFILRYKRCLLVYL